MIVTKSLSLVVVAISGVVIGLGNKCLVILQYIL
jgi:hypothetical protein